jgi:peptidoglycan/xylan/chitin deacetylase (PgdA/CDA1 family)/folate-dependent phosphoribosylglycinamide formyltransferase PurN
MTAKGSEFRVVIFSSGSPATIGRLIRRIHAEVPGARVCGVLCERRPPKPPAKRVATFLRNLKDPSFVRYAAAKVARAAVARCASLGTALLHGFHAGRPAPVADEDLEALGRATRAAIHVTTDYHGEEALAFVRGLEPDLGLVYGTRILKPSLFAIPTHGSINIHKRKVPDYRGGGPVGLWELLDDQPEIGVTVHQVTEKLDAGHVVNTATIPIEPFDTLTSLALKAHVVGNDLLVRSVADYASDTVRFQPQQGTGKMFKSPTPQQLARYEKALARRRPSYRAERSRPVAKLLVKTALALPAVTLRNWKRRRQGRHPVTILFHHLVADRPHRMGMSTEHFLKHIQFLRKHYRIVSLTTAIEMLRAGRVDAPTVVLTFDDGYVDNFFTLRAIVEETGVPITLFVSTEHIDSQREFDHDTRAGTRGFAPLTWEQLRQLQREGFEIGSHTRTHFDCGSRDRARLEDEIVGSKRDLETHLGGVLDVFSYPCGLPPNMSLEATEIAGDAYQCVVSAFGGTNVPAASGEVRHLKRAFHANHLWDLELMIQGALEQEPAFTYPRVVPRQAAPPMREAVLQAQGD